MTDGYADNRISCTDEGIKIRGYYFPWGTKHIAYSSIRSVQRVNIGLLFGGKGRIWGTSNPRYWANFDPQRPRKSEAFILDVGRSVCPFITPDDPDAVDEAIQQHTDLGPAERGGQPPFI